MNDTSAVGPLAGVKVVEIAGIGPGPFAAMVLADLGAEVVRVERPGGAPLSFGDSTKDVLNRGRRNVVLDLKQERGVETLLALTSHADLVIEGFRPGVAERLGFGPDAVLAANPAAVYGRITGWGQDGPLAQTAGHDLNYIAITGALAVSSSGPAPVFPQNLLGDFAGGSLYLVIGLLAALTHARSTGEGQVVDAAIVDGVTHLLAMPMAARQAGVWDGTRGTGLLGGGAPFYDVFATADGQFLTVGALEAKFWDAFVERIGVDLPDRNDLRNWPELRRVLTERIAERSQAEWVRVFDGSDACVAPVVPFDEAIDHPHLAARASIVDVHGFIQPAPAPRFSRTPAELSTPPAVPGAHTRETLLAWGIDDADDLLAAGIAIQG